MTGDVVQSDELALRRVEQAAREFCAAMRATEGTKLGMIDIVPMVISVFREEGIAFDPQSMAGMAGMLS